MNALLRAAVLGIGVGAVSLLSPLASAQDGGNSQSSANYNWTGWSGGGFGGGLFGGSDFGSALDNGSPCTFGPCLTFANQTVSAHPASASAGAQIGYNWRTGNYVYGLEADVNIYRLVGTNNTAVFDSGTGITHFFHTEASSHVTFDLRPRIGILNGPALFYATGGLAVTDIHYAHNYTNSAGAFQDPETVNRAVAGWTVGGGLEYALSRYVSFRAEYLFTRFSVDAPTAFARNPNGSLGNGAGAGTTCGVNLVQCFENSVELNTNSLRTGLNFKF
jgi:outer membrane immunogenic protein